MATSNGAEWVFAGSITSNGFYLSKRTNQNGFVVGNAPAYWFAVGH